MRHNDEQNSTLYVGLLYE